MSKVITLEELKKELGEKQVQELQLRSAYYQIMGQVEYLKDKIAKLEAVKEEKPKESEKK